MVTTSISFVSSQVICTFLFTFLPLTKDIDIHNSHKDYCFYKPIENLSLKHCHSFLCTDKRKHQRGKPVWAFL
jgi:hypothetical protein